MNNKIFISSTDYDLIDLRAEIKQFILSIGLIPVMSDHHDTDFKTYQDKNSSDTCLVNLASCDTIIVVLSKRYGASLVKAGFGNYSATHLEYLEAKKLNKKILFFIRDRLYVDYQAYIKTKDIESLFWISDKQKDLRLFDFIQEHKELNKDNNNNWFWSFKDSPDIKEILRTELKDEIRRNRLDNLIYSGNIPLLTFSAVATQTPNPGTIEMNILIDNLGNQSAIDCSMVIYYAQNYNAVLERKRTSELTSQSYTFFHLKAGEQLKIDRFLHQISLEEIKTSISRRTVEISYKTIHGDYLSDITEFVIRHPLLHIYCQYANKRYINEGGFEKIVGSGL